MRYPVYIFLLISGFFYLTGNPFSDETSQTAQQGAQGKVANLKYGRQISEPSTPENVAEPQTIAARDKPIVTAKPELVAKSTQSAKILDAQMQPSAVEKASLPSSVVSLEQTSPASTPFAQDQQKSVESRAKKSLDWTVFGNQRKNASVALPVRTRSQGEIDAPDITGEPAQAAGYEPRELAEKSVRKSQSLKARRAARKARRAARKARRAKRRLARLKRRSKRAYRIARKAKKESAVKQPVANKPRPREFGFAFTGAQARLTK